MSEIFTIGTPKEAASIEKGYFESIIDVSPTLENVPPGVTLDRGHSEVIQARGTPTPPESLLHSDSLGSDSFNVGIYGPYDDDVQS